MHAATERWERRPDGSALRSRTLVFVPRTDEVPAGGLLRLAMRRVPTEEWTLLDVDDSCARTIYGNGRETLTLELRTYADQALATLEITLASPGHRSASDAPALSNALRTEVRQLGLDVDAERIERAMTFAAHGRGVARTRESVRHPTPTTLGVRLSEAGYSRRADAYVRASTGTTPPSSTFELRLDGDDAEIALDSRVPAR